VIEIIETLNLRVTKTRDWAILWKECLSIPVGNLPAQTIGTLMWRLRLPMGRAFFL
jgi:hypothetical protein